MLITMLSTRRVSEDGFAQRRLEKGKTYDIADTAARSAIRNGWALDTEYTTAYLAALVEAV